MNSREIEEAIERYNKRLDTFGVSEEALGWGPKGRSRLRYEILISQWDFNNQAVLDFGCGFGNLYEYMIRRNITNLRYTGIDINERLITIAQEQHKGDATFITGNLLTEIFNDRVDYILASGVFNYKLENNFEFISSCFDKFNEISKKGFAVNFLSDKAAIQYESNCYSSPAQILELAYKYSKKVVLRNDYMPYEFTIFVDKTEIIDPELTVYKEYVKYV